VTVPFIPFCSWSPTGQYHLYLPGLLRSAVSVAESPDWRTLVSTSPSGPSISSAQAIGESGEVLDDAVVEVLGDPPALVVGGDDRVPEERLALLLAVAQPPGERPRERKLEEREQEQGAERGGREGGEYPSLSGLDRRRGQVPSNSSGRPSVARTRV